MATKTTTKPAASKAQAKAKTTGGVSVVIAFRDMGDPHRLASQAYVDGWYSATGYEIVHESLDGREFGRAAAINEGVRRATGDIIVQADPDSIVHLGVLADAVAMARDADGLVIPHHRYLYLTPEYTRRILDGESMPDEATSAHCETVGLAGSGNVVVFSRKTWETVHGFDERFGLWGGDDAAFAYACQAWFGDHRRLAGDVVHLWHPRLPQSFPGHPGYVDQFAILAQYRDAAAISADAIQQLVLSR